MNMQVLKLAKGNPTKQMRQNTKFINIFIVGCFNQVWLREVLPYLKKQNLDLN